MVTIPRITNIVCKIIRRCGASGGEPVSVTTFLEVLGSCHIELEPKEMARLERITSEEGVIEQEEFMEYAKRSAAVKEFSLRGSKNSGANLDKAELAFKVSPER